MRNLTEDEIIEYFNVCCDSAVELLELRTILEQTGHILTWRAMLAYNSLMIKFYKTDSII